MKPLKSPTHIHLFDENFYGFETVFCIMVFGIFSIFYVRIMQSENFATNIHTHYRQSETAPYTRIIYKKNFAPRYIRELRCVWNLWAIDWALVSWRSFVSRFVYAVIVWISLFFVDWSMSKFDYKSVMGLHKFIVKMWLCRCNCMCICVCIWCWLWFVIVLIRQSSGCSQIDEVRLM